MNKRFFVEFHPNRTARRKYAMDESLFKTNGDVVFTNLRTVRELTEKLRTSQPDIQASEVNAMGLLHEIEHIVLQTYREKSLHDFYVLLENFLLKKLGKDKYEQLLQKFCAHFPPTSVFRNTLSVENYLAGKTAGLPNRFLLLEEMIPLWVDNLNPAFNPIKQLINTNELNKEINFKQTYALLKEFFAKQPLVPGTRYTVLKFLRLPAELYPHSIMAQLEYIKNYWQSFLGNLLNRLLQGIDFIREEEKMRFSQAAFGPGPTVVPEFEAGFEPERFSQDTHWMPRLVLIAKSTYVWLDQLSKKYRREIHRLDQIPNEELEHLSRFGITGLWLIGIWERSKASQKIKQLTGNPEAMASAYSLYDYIVAENVGGESALQNLKDRAQNYGIRMATDMVPNHTGIDSKWIIEHPDWFIHLPYAPFPQYSFNGPDLCDHPEVGVFIEDGYWERRDAAVVFKRVHYPSGETHYIYHGNDGTSMPWNDTAQLNYLNHEVREAIIQKIITIARQFPIIRFDAAMTLTKKHFQRLWFPQPGHGGDIPSRAEFAMTKREFNQHFPSEFWREVVDRVQKEAPDTLLLAEAFWMMESYFVRTLGMHRVYNSAFMNMLKNEENDKYRLLIKNVLEFNPQILKRYVNFMNNPDEETAAVQFGKGDKYFGVCIMMVTMPGLPMFGHGQLEGFTEKYGMEYRRAYWNEEEDQELIRQHYQLIAPLLHKRFLFSEVDHFLFYDVIAPEGNVNESLFAYSNRFNEQNALVVYNNSFSAAAGWINISVPFKQNEQMVQHNLVKGLGLHEAPGQFVIFKDHVTGLEFIRRFEEMQKKGLFISLGAYKFNVFLDFKVVASSPDAPYGELYNRLQGNGVPNLQRALLEIFYRPVHQAVSSLLNVDFIENRLIAHLPPVQTFEQMLNRYDQCCREVAQFEGLEPLARIQLQSLLKKFNHLFELMDYGLFKEKAIDENGFSLILVRLKQDFAPQLPELEMDLKVLQVWAVLAALKAQYAPADELDFGFLASRLFDQIFNRHLEMMIEDGKNATVTLELLQILTVFANGMDFKTKDQMRLALESMLSLSVTAKYLDIHPFEGVYYFNKERFEELIFWLFFLSLLERCPKPAKNCRQKLRQAKKAESLFKEAAKSGYRWYDFLESLRKKNLQSIKGSN